MTGPRIFLVLHALAAIALLYSLAPLAGAQGSVTGMVMLLAAQWGFYCLPAMLLHLRGERRGRLYSEKLAWRDWWIALPLLLQPPLLALILLMPHTGALSSHAASVAALMGVSHGVLAEAGWRGAFICRFAENPRLGFWLSWGLGLLAQASLLAAPGLIPLLPGVELLGGIAVLSLFWTWLAWRTFSIFWSTILHALGMTTLLWLVFSAAGIA